MHHATLTTMIFALTAGLASGCRGGQEQECPGWESGQQDTGDEAGEETSPPQGLDLRSGAWYYEGALPGAEPVEEGAYPCFELGSDHAVHAYTVDLDTEEHQGETEIGPYLVIQDPDYGTLSVQVGTSYQWAVARSYGAIGNSGYVTVEDRQTFEFETLAISPCGG